MNIENALETYGLNSQQSRVYIYLVQHLDANVTDMVRSLKIPRASIYKVIDALEAEGLISRFRKNKTLYVTPTSISQLEKNITDKLLAVQSVLPDLRSLSGQAMNKTEIELGTGIQGVKNTYDAIYAILKKQGHKEMYIISGSGSQDMIQKFLREWKQKVSDLNIYTKVLLPKQAEQFAKKSTLKKIERKFYSDAFIFSGTMILVSGYTAIITFNGVKSQATLIRSDDTHNMMQNIWNMLWQANH